MISANRDALLCDMAETYGIYDLRALPVSTLATLAVGLREDSRIRMYMNGTKITRLEMLLAAAVDRLSLLWWSKTEDAQNNKNRPKSMLTIMLGEQTEPSGNVEAFETVDEFESEWERITGVKHE
jgi:hypothetical protein